MKHLFSIFMLTSALTLGACTTVSGPAVLAEQSAQSHQELEAVVSKAMGGARVSLANDVLTEKNTMTVEQKMNRSIAGDPLMGRRMDRPHHFTLEKIGSKCVLTHDETGDNYPLASAQCISTGS